MTSVLFAGAGFRAIEMHAHDVPRLAAFFDANPAYHLAISGAPAPPGAAQEEFDSRPPADFPMRRKWMLLFESDSGEVIGMADLLQDLFAEGIWHVGTFIIATSLHGTGRPPAIYDAMERWMASQGARWLRLGVVETNRRAAAFWRRVGYSPMKVREGFEIGGRAHRLHVMAKPLAEADWAWYLQAVPRDKPGLGMATIRPLEPSDQEALWNWLHLALWDPPPAGLRPREVLQNPAVSIYAEGWGREGDVGVVCVADGKDVGACWMRRIRGGVGLGYVDDDTPQLGIALLPEYRGRGFGRLLMVSALEAAAAAGYAQVSLTVHPQNPAIKLYKSVGFEQKAVRNTYLLMVAPTPLVPAR